MAGAFTFIDLFAGIGGLRRGFEPIGGKCVFTCEWDRYSQQTYRANFSSGEHRIAGDIRDVKAHDIRPTTYYSRGFRASLFPSPAYRRRMPSTAPTDLPARPKAPCSTKSRAFCGTTGRRLFFSKT